MIFPKFPLRTESGLMIVNVRFDMRVVVLLLRIGRRIIPVILRLPEPRSAKRARPGPPQIPSFPRGVESPRVSPQLGILRSFAVLRRSALRAPAPPAAQDDSYCVVMIAEIPAASSFARTLAAWSRVSNGPRRTR